MKLTTPQSEEVADQLDAQPIADDHPSFSELEDAFGNHTFFLLADGLHIVEPMEEPEPAGEVTVIKVATWASEERRTLVPHEPQVTATVVKVRSGDPEPN